MVDWFTTSYPTDIVAPSGWSTTRPHLHYRWLETAGYKSLCLRTGYSSHRLFRRSTPGMSQQRYWVAVIQGLTWKLARQSFLRAWWECGSAPTVASNLMGESTDHSSSAPRRSLWRFLASDSGCPRRGDMALLKECENVALTALMSFEQRSVRLSIHY